MQSLAKRVSLVTDSPDCYVSQENPSEIDKGCATSSSSTSTRPSRRGVHPVSAHLPGLSGLCRGRRQRGGSPLPELTEALDALKALPRTRVMAREMLERLYSKAFVDELAAGVDYVAVNPEGRRQDPCARRGGRRPHALQPLHHRPGDDPGGAGTRRVLGSRAVHHARGVCLVLLPFRCRGLLREGAESCQPERHLRRGPAPA